MDDNKERHEINEMTPIEMWEAIRAGHFNQDK